MGNQNQVGGGRLRRLFLVLCVSAGVVLPGFSASAQSPTDNYVASLRALGYERVEIDRTFLGRYRITAERDGAVREIVMARNGMVLFDYLDVTSNPPTPATPIDNDPVVAPTDEKGAGNE